MSGRWFWLLLFSNVFLTLTNLQGCGGGDDADTDDDADTTAGPAAAVAAATPAPTAVVDVATTSEAMEEMTTADPGPVTPMPTAMVTPMPTDMAASGYGYGYRALADDEVLPGVVDVVVG